MIEARGLCKRFGGVDALRGVDVTLRRGQVTAIVGPNGAGKSTVLRIILGLARSDRGVVTIDGTPLDGGEAYRNRLGYMPQIARFPENLRGNELLALLRKLRGDPSAFDDRLFRLFDLAAPMGARLGTLSGGTRQRINAAFAFAFQPDLLVLDEPTSGLDPGSSAILKDRILASRADGGTIVVTSHVMSDLEEIADDIVFLVEGTVRFSGTVAALVETTCQRNLERAVASLLAARAA